uniref:Protein SufA n=1 Tax=Anthurium amnicola TaxID=1678845 RepID=A0A1D1Y232_9ARAE
MSLLCLDTRVVTRSITRSPPVPKNSSQLCEMDKPKFFLNPNAAPFIPKLKKASEVGFEKENMDPIVMFHDSATHEETVVHEAFNPAWQLSTDVTENLLIFDEDSEWRDYQTLDPEDQVPQYDTMGIGKQDLDDGSQIAQEYLSSLFPNFSVESVNEVYRACGNVVEAKFLLEQLEGHDDKSQSLFDDLHSSGTASSSCHNDTLSDAVSPPDSEAVQYQNSADAYST